MQYQRRQIEDGRQRWEDTPEAQKYARWFAGWERRLRLLKLATIVFAVQTVAWFVLAWNDVSIAPVVFASMLIPAAYAVYIIAWSIKEL